MLNGTVGVFKLCTVTLIMLHIEIGNRTAIHRKATGVAGRIRIGIHKHIADGTAVDRSQCTGGIGTDPQIGTVL